MLLVCDLRKQWNQQARPCILVPVSNLTSMMLFVCCVVNVFPCSFCKDCKPTCKVGGVCSSVYVAMTPTMLSVYVCWTQHGVCEGAACYGAW